MASPSAGAPALKYGDVNTETTSPGEVKGLITDTNSLFYGCSSLLKLDLNNFITNPETSMENMFSGCVKLEYLDISGFNINSYIFLIV